MSTSHIASAELGLPEEAELIQPRIHLLPPHVPRLTPRAHDAAMSYVPAAGRRFSWRQACLPFADAISAWIALELMLRAFAIPGGRELAVLGAPLAVLLCKLSNAYDRDHVRVRTSTLDEVPTLLSLSGVVTLAISMLAPLTSRGLTGEQVPLLWVALSLALIAGRWTARSLTGRLIKPGRCLVIGDATQADRIRERLLADGSNASVVATAAISREHLTASTEVELSLRRLAYELDADRIIVAPSLESLTDLPDLIRVAKAVGVGVSVVPDLFACAGASVEFDEINGMALLGVRPLSPSRGSLVLKRAFDLIIASIALALLAPLLALIACAIRLDSRGPILFRQLRVGRNGNHFSIIKFRSMEADAEARKEALRPLSGVGDGMFKVFDDPRVTRVGRFLRRSSLDELPQIFNVLRGEMSLVGPRPLVIDEDAAILGLDRSRLHLMPGMTGPWQVLRTRVSRQEMIEIDYRYVASWSLWLDLKIVIRTALHVIRRRNV